MWCKNETHENIRIMFLSKTDLGTSMYGYQIDQITEGNDTIIEVALSAAEEEMRSYLSGNHKKEWLDGRLHYDADAILSATDSDRNTLLVKHGVAIAKWWIVDLANVDIIYEQAKERYDRTVDWLRQLAEGSITLSTLPTLDDDSVQTDKAFRYGSRKKFNHEY